MSNDAATFEIRRDLVWKAPLLIIGAVESNSWVKVSDSALEIEFGSYKTTIDVADIVSLEPIEWPLWQGIGIRLNFQKAIGLIGSTDGVVQLKLRQPNVSFLGVGCDTVAISLVDPEAFIAQLGR